MKKIFIIIITLCTCLQMQAQQGSTRWYAGVQAGVPLFWGDIRSVGEKTNLGFGGGIFAGVRATPWLAFEPSVDYGVGKLGASKWQTNDYIDNNGVIRYTAGNWKLGDVYSKTSFLRLGLRIPVSIIRAFNPATESGFEIEVAPHLALNKFTPAIYEVSTDKKLTDGAKAANLAYAVGGDVAFNFKVSPRAAIFLRPSVSWLSDEGFEGLRSDPVWRVNLMNYTTLGLKFDLGNAAINH